MMSGRDAKKAIKYFDDAITRYVKFLAEAIHSTIWGS